MINRGYNGAHTLPRFLLLRYFIGVTSKSYSYARVSWNAYISYLGKACLSTSNIWKSDFTATKKASRATLASPATYSI